jgi:hypothetical protein
MGTASYFPVFSASTLCRSNVSNSTAPVSLFRITQLVVLTGLSVVRLCVTIGIRLVEVKYGVTCIA